MDVKPFLIGVLVGYVASLFVPLRLSVNGLGTSSPRSDRPPGMTGGGPGWENNPGT